MACPKDAHLLYLIIMAGRICVLICLLCSTAFSQQGFDPAYIYDSVDSLIWRGILLVDAEQFDSAITLFQKVIEADTTSPRGYFYVAAAYSNLTNDYKNLSYKAQFYEHVDRAIKIGELKEESGRASSEDLFYYGGAVGYRGIFRSFDGDWWGAFKDGLRGRHLLEEAFEADSANMDIYLGLGAYDYWRSAKTKSLWWLPFFSDERNQGIDEIKKAMEYGKFSSHECKYSLMRIYFDYGKYQSDIEFWENEVKQLNPEDPFSLYWAGQSYIALGQYDKGIAAFDTILAVFQRSLYFDPGGEMECRYFLGLCWYKLGDLKKSMQQLSKASSLADRLSDRNDLENLDDVGPLFETVKKEFERK